MFSGFFVSTEMLGSRLGISLVFVQVCDTETLPLNIQGEEHVQHVQWPYVQWPYALSSLVFLCNVVPGGWFVCICVCTHTHTHTIMLDPHAHIIHTTLNVGHMHTRTYHPLGRTYIAPSVILRSQCLINCPSLLTRYVPTAFFHSLLHVNSSPTAAW